MAWDFTTEPEFQAKLDWANGFVEDKVYKVDVLWPHDNYKPTKDLTDEQRSVIQPLKDEVRKQGLWAYYRLTSAASPFHRSLIKCLKECFRDVPELAADAKRASRTCCQPGKCR